MQAEIVEVVAIGIALDDRPRPDRQARTDLYIRKPVLARRQCRVKHIRLAQRGAIVDPHPGFDHCRRFGRRNLPRFLCGNPHLHRQLPNDGFRLLQVFYNKSGAFVIAFKLLPEAKRQLTSARLISTSGPPWARDFFCRARTPFSSRGNRSRAPACRSGNSRLAHRRGSAVVAL